MEYFSLIAKFICSKLDINNFFFHVQSTQTLKIDNPYFFQTSFSFTKCAPFFQKIKEEFILMIRREKWLEPMIIFFRREKWLKLMNFFLEGKKSIWTHFVRLCFLTLKIMDFENVALTKVVHIYVIKGKNA